MKQLSKIGLLTLSLLFLVNGCGVAKNTTTDVVKTKSPLIITVDEVLWWLPEDTEVVGVLRKPRDKVGLGISSVAMGSVKRGEFAKKLQQYPPLLVLEGSRRFRSPRGFGIMTFEGCTIIINDAQTSEYSELHKWLAKSANRTQQIAAFKTYIFDEKIENDQWHFLITQLAPNIWLCATNKKYLESVLLRRLRNKQERGKTTRAVPETLPEWKYVDTGAQEWAIRHYRKDQALLDPTSPLTEPERKAILADKGAIGITYSFDTRSNTATLNYLTAPKHVHRMEKVYKDFWRSFFRWMNVEESDLRHLEPKVNSRSAGVVKMEFDFSKTDIQEKAGIFGFGLLGLFGRAIVV